MHFQKSNSLHESLFFHLRFEKLNYWFVWSQIVTFMHLKIQLVNIIRSVVFSHHWLPAWTTRPAAIDADAACDNERPRSVPGQRVFTPLCEPAHWLYWPCFVASCVDDAPRPLCFFWSETRLRCCWFSNITNITSSVTVRLTYHSS